MWFFFFSLPQTIWKLDFKLTKNFWNLVLRYAFFVCISNNQISFPRNYLNKKLANFQEMLEMIIWKNFIRKNLFQSMNLVFSSFDWKGTDLISLNFVSLNQSLGVQRYSQCIQSNWSDKVFWRTVVLAWSMAIQRIDILRSRKRISSYLTLGLQVKNLEDKTR